jgi:GT2 family glycosyltransferase
VCTRDRTEYLQPCLDALCRLDYPDLDLLVVDNAPSSNATADLVKARYPGVRYVREPTPGLDWARNRAIAEARGEIIAFTDDDAIVDAGWVAALVRVFAEEPDVAAVTGLVVPYELDTDAQQLFEVYGGFGRGFQRRRISATESANHFAIYGTGQLGTGANMAFRHAVFDDIGLFDPALDVGTVTNGGGDLEMFFRVQRAGHTLVYEPCAVVRHRHRRDLAELRTQIHDNGIGLYSYLVRTALAYPNERMAIAWFGLWWLWRWSIRRLVGSVLRPQRLPRELILAEMWGAFVGLRRYPQARRTAGKYTTLEARPSAPSALPARASGGVAVRMVEVRQPIEAVADVAGYAGLRIVAQQAGRPIGYVDLSCAGEATVSSARIREALVNGLGLKLLGDLLEAAPRTRRALALAALMRRYVPEQRPSAVRVPEVSVSVVVATYDRPKDLLECLTSLTALESRRPSEIVVVDNHPESGLTPPVVSEFPQVVLVSERRKGSSFARNAGILASHGEIIVVTDDDVTVPKDWLAHVLGPFDRPDVGIVTGNVLPRELETRAQWVFESYGGLGRGFERREYARDWLDAHRRSAAPTWELGGTANAAFRAEVFANPHVGLFDEALSTGTSAGGGEDIHLFYKAIQAGYTLVYEPSAYVWHRHRREMAALRKQIYNYSKGHVSYHLTTLIRDRDRRALIYLAARLPRSHLSRTKRRLLRQSDYPISLILLEIAGNLASPLGLWRSVWRVSRRGHSNHTPQSVPGQALQTDARPSSRQLTSATVEPR